MLNTNYEIYRTENVNSNWNWLDFAAGVGTVAGFVGIAAGTCALMTGVC